MFKLYRETDKKNALAYALKSLSLSKKHDNVDIFLKAANAVGWLYQKENNFDSAIFYHNEALQTAINYNRKDRQMYTYNNLGLIYNKLNLFDKALENFFNSLKLSKELERTDVEISSLNNIGGIYRKIGNNPQALSYFQKCVEIMKKNGDPLADETTVNIGFTYIDMEKLNQAISTFNAVLEADPALPLKVSAYYGLGESYLQLNDLKNSKKHITVALDSAQKENNDYYIALSYFTLGKIAHFENNPSVAITNLKNAMSFADKIKSMGIKHDITLLMSKIFEKQNEVGKAYAALYEAYILQDSLHSEDFAENFKNIHLRIEKEKADEIILRKEIQIERQRLISIGTGIISTIGFFAAFVFWRSTVIVKRSRNALSAANETIEHQNKELTKLNHSLERMVDERTHELLKANNSLTRVNDELDNFIHMTSSDIRGPLASLRGVCNVALLDVTDPTAREYIMRLDKTSNTLHSIFTRLVTINQINHESLSHDKIDFEEILAEVLQLEKAKGIPSKINVETSIQPGIIFYSDPTIIRLILENLVSNAIKFHDKTEFVKSFISIKVFTELDKLKLVVLDNGLGTDLHNKKKIFSILNRGTPQHTQGGTGLYLTKLACEKLGGDIRFNSSAEGYTEFCVTFPLQVNGSINSTPATTSPIPKNDSKDLSLI